MQLFVLVATSAAQLSISSPASDTQIKSCDDFAFQQLGNGWDMSDTADINNFFPSVDLSGFSSAQMSGGSFSGTAIGTGATMYLWSPVPCGAYPVGGRWGQDLTVDTSKYDTLSIRMNTDIVDANGLRFIWDRDCNYATTRAVTLPTATLIGNQTYSIDLDSVSLDTATSSAPWSSGSITGFAILPTAQNGANISIDWIRLEDSSSCGSSSISYSYAGGAAGYYISGWLDDDTNPFNGYAKQFASAASNASTTGNYNTLGMYPGSYNVLGLYHSDYRTLELADPWDMSQSTDVYVTTGVSSATFSNGVYSGITSSSAPNIYMRITGSGIDTSKYSKLSLKMSRSSNATEIRLLWAGGYADLTKATHDVDNDDVYQIDMSGQSGWSGTITEFVIRPALASGVSFNFDFLSLRGSGYVTSLDTSTIASSIVAGAGRVIVNEPPVLSFEKPGKEGGEAIAPWNAREDDFVTFSNLRTSADATYPSESYTSYLPDSRLVEDLRGDFFKGTNIEGSNDPVNYSTFPNAGAKITFDAATYHNLCFKLFIDRAFDLGAGSVARALWKAQGVDFRTTEDIVLIYDGWSGSPWYEYCVDMSLIPRDGLSDTDWSGTIEAFRVDAHEFTSATTYYLDYVKLRRDNRADNKFVIAYDLNDADNAANASLYYTSAATASGGTLIASLSESEGLYEWDTSGVPNGNYGIYAVSSDGTNSTTSLAKGRVIINHSSATANIAPVLNLESPAASRTVCSSLQLKGYALQSDRYEEVAGVQVKIDGTLLGVIQPSLYSPAAVLAYPSADSSNTGFNTSYDISGYANGSHTVVVRALSSDGAAASSTVQITKASSGCPDALSDADPSGTPVAAVPEDSLPKPSAPKLGASISSAGKLTLKLQRATQSGATCSLSIKVGSDKDAVDTLAKSLTPTKAKFNLTVSGVKLNKKALKKFFLSAVKECDGYQASSSAARKVGAKAKGKISTIAELAAKMSGLKAKRIRARRR